MGDPTDDDVQKGQDALEQYEFEREMEHAERTASIRPFVPRTPLPLVEGAAKRSDWNTLPMPEERATVSFDAELSWRGFEKLARGATPQRMEDKWFVYFEDPWLYVHRSWTGYCIYMVRLEHADDRVRAVEVVVNRDPGQFGTGDPTGDLDFVRELFWLAEH